MTQEEVDLIYDYLHEYCHYKDGELIIKKNTPNKKIGSTLGHFVSCSREGNPYIKVSLPKSLFKDTRERQISLSHCIYIYHYKKKSKYIFFKDDNHANTKIENLIAKEKAYLRGKIGNRTKELKYIYERHLKSGTVYCVRGQLDDKKIIVGGYTDKEIALKAAYLLNELKYTGLTVKEIKQKVLETYPMVPIKTNKTGYIGVYKYGKKYYTAYLYSNKKRMKLGRYETAEEANESYLKAKKDLLK